MWVKYTFKHMCDCATYCRCNSVGYTFYGLNHQIQLIRAPYFMYMYVAIYKIVYS